MPSFLERTAVTAQNLKLLIHGRTFGHQHLSSPSRFTIALTANATIINIPIFWSTFSTIEYESSLNLTYILTPVNPIPPNVSLRRSSSMHNRLALPIALSMCLRFGSIPTRSATRKARPFPFPWLNAWTIYRKSLKEFRRWLSPKRVCSWSWCICFTERKTSKNGWKKIYWNSGLQRYPCDEDSPFSLRPYGANRNLFLLHFPLLPGYYLHWWVQVPESSLHCSLWHHFFFWLVRLLIWRSSYRNTLW